MSDSRELRDFQVLEDVVGGTPYGDEIVADAYRVADQVWHRREGVMDSLTERIGLVKAFIRIHEGFPDEAKETPLSEKIDITEKALAILDPEWK